MQDSVLGMRHLLYRFLEQGVSCLPHNLAEIESFEVYIAEHSLILEDWPWKSQMSQSVSSYHSEGQFSIRNFGFSGLLLIAC